MNPFSSNFFSTHSHRTNQESENEIIKILLINQPTDLVGVVKDDHPSDKMLVLDLCSQKLSAKDLRPVTEGLKAGNYPSNTVIRLWWNDFGDEGIGLIAEALRSGKCPEKLTLDLSYNDIGLEGFRYLANALQSGFCPKDLTIRLNKITINPDVARILASAMVKGKLPEGFNLYVDYDEDTLNAINDIARRALKKIEQQTSFGFEAEQLLQQIEACYFAAKTLSGSYTFAKDNGANTITFVFAAYQQLITLLAPNVVFSHMAMAITMPGSGNLQNMYTEVNYMKDLPVLSAKNQKIIKDLNDSYAKFFLICKDDMDNLFDDRMSLFSMSENLSGFSSGPTKKTTVYEEGNGKRYDFNDKFGEKIGLGHQVEHIWRLHYDKIMNAGEQLSKLCAKINEGNWSEEDSGQLSTFMQEVEFYCRAIFECVPEYQEQYILERYIKSIIPVLMTAYQNFIELLINGHREFLVNGECISELEFQDISYLLQRARYFFNKYTNLFSGEDRLRFAEFLQKSYLFLSEQGNRGVPKNTKNDLTKRWEEARTMALKLAILEKNAQLDEFTNKKNFGVEPSVLGQGKAGLVYYLENGVVNNKYGFVETQVKVEEKLPVVAEKAAEVTVTNSQETKNEKIDKVLMRRDVFIGWGHVDFYLKAKHFNLNEYRQAHGFFQNAQENKKSNYTDLFVKRDDNAVKNDSTKTLQLA